MTIKNWLGLDKHLTDEYLHWECDLEEMLRIRKLYKESLEGNENSLIELMDEISHNGFLLGVDR